MCIAILNTPKGGIISKESLNNCWKNNTDGAGMVYHADGVLTVVKEMKNFERFYKAYVDAREKYPSNSFVLHFRIGTHGRKDKDNCHPFLVNKDLAFVHNGIISGMPVDKDMSDTGVFNKTILQALPEGFIKNLAVRRLIRAFIGNSNKLIFLAADGFAHITNEEAGNWFEENWYSNFTYKYSGGQYIDYGGMTVKKTQRGAVKVKGFQANNVYVPANKISSMEKKNGIYQPKSISESSEYNRWKANSNKNYCEECSSELTDRMEHYYGFCTTCLSKYGMKAEEFE